VQAYIGPTFVVFPFYAVLGRMGAIALQSCFNAVNNRRREKVFLQAPRFVNECKRSQRAFVRIFKSATSYL